MDRFGSLLIESQNSYAWRSPATSLRSSAPKGRPSMARGVSPWNDGFVRNLLGFLKVPRAGGTPESSNQEGTWHMLLSPGAGWRRWLMNPGPAGAEERSE